MLQKLSRLDKLEIILAIFFIFSFFAAFDSQSPKQGTGIIAAACVASIVWIEIYRAKSKEK